MVKINFNKAAVGAVNDQAKKLERFDLDMAHHANLNDDVVETGRAPRSTAIAALKLMNDQEKKKKAGADLLRELSDLDRHLAQLEQRRQQLVQENTRLKEDNSQLSKEIDVLEKAIEEQDFEISEGGKFSNKAVDDAITAYEKERGWKIDRNNPDAIQNALFLMIAIKKDQIHQNTIQINKNNRDIENITEEINANKHKGEHKQTSDFFIQKNETSEVTNEDLDLSDSLSDLGDDLLETVAEAKPEAEDKLEDLAEDLLGNNNDKLNPSGIDLSKEFGKAANPPDEENTHDLKSTEAYVKPLPPTPPTMG